MESAQALAPKGANSLGQSDRSVAQPQEATAPKAASILGLQAHPALPTGENTPDQPAHPVLPKAVSTQGQLAPHPDAPMGENTPDQPAYLHNRASAHHLGKDPDDTDHQQKLP